MYLDTANDLSLLERGGLRDHTAEDPHPSGTSSNDITTDFGSQHQMRRIGRAVSRDLARLTRFSTRALWSDTITAKVAKTPLRNLNAGLQQWGPRYHRIQWPSGSNSYSLFPLPRPLSTGKPWTSFTCQRLHSAYNPYTAEPLSWFPSVSYDS